MKGSQETALITGMISLIQFDEYLIMIPVWNGGDIDHSQEKKHQ